MTDRDKIKAQEKGTYVTAASISDAFTTVDEMHRRPLNFARTGSENAATNVAETPGGVITRLSKVRTIKVVSKDSIVNNASNYAKLYIYKYNTTAGAKTLIGSWNTATAAQSAITAFQNHSLSLVTAACASVAAGSVITYHVGKFGAGKALATFSVTIDAEEI